MTGRGDGDFEVRISSDQAAIRVPRMRIAELVRFVARREKARVEEVDVAVVSARRIAAINHEFLGRRKITDVLSFDLSDSPDGPLFAEIVVCGEVAARQALLRGHGPRRELLLYVAHGMLHLLGYDDRNQTAADRMHRREEQLLDEFLDTRRKRGPGAPSHARP
jgi:probable rRNA maturation factor